MVQFSSFDPLSARYTNTEVAAHAVKREIKNILNSYVGWFDSFCELIQNSLDSIEERSKKEDDNYIPRIWITVNIKDNYLYVTDNGNGLDEQKYTKFLAPNISFKSGSTRGHKGVGATYLAYGFNYIQICSRTDDYTVVGKMVNARKWLDEENPSGNPQVKFDAEGPMDDNFRKLDKGVSICIKFDETTHPKRLDWIKADKADNWMKILSVKTGLGSIFPNEKVVVNIKVIDKDGKVSEIEQKGIHYLWIDKVVLKSASYKAIKLKMDQLYSKMGQNFKLPSSLTNLDAFYETFSTKDLTDMLSLDEDESEICNRLEPTIYIAYVYSTSVWKEFNESLGVRSNMKILQGGIQIAANNMPQGEIIQIPLQRNIGRQNQIHMVMHFKNCSADLGRKGFQREIVEFCKEVSKKLADGPLQKMKFTLRQNTGANSDLMREKKVDDWKQEMQKHEVENPLLLISEHFFLPLKKVSITSIPTREQDVIALFNQLIAGGVIRGIRIMSTNERLTYDGLFKIVFDDPMSNHLYDRDKNPLGVLEEYAKSCIGLVSAPKVLEYKYSLDGLIEDIEAGDKNSNEISLVIVWETGNSYEGNYKITSLLDDDNLSLRHYHGITHIMTNLTTGQKEMELIVLKELIDFLNDPEETKKLQIEKYEAY